MKKGEIIKILEKYDQEQRDLINDIPLILEEIKKISQASRPGKDIEQQWKPIKGHAVETIIEYLLDVKIRKLGLKIMSGKALDKISDEKISPEMFKLKGNLLLKFSDCGHFLPDVDLIIYVPNSCDVVAVVSIKSSLRERIAQTGFWKLKLANAGGREHIKTYFITLDDDGVFSLGKTMTKPRAIAETSIDGTYVVTTSPIREARLVKTFDKFFIDLERHANSIKKKSISA